MTNYRPLPSEVTIKQSDIEGMGLFSTCAIKEGFNIGMTHYKAPELEHGWCRSPLGGFINHREEPNCELIGIGKSKYLITLYDIMPDEELTLKYTLYSVSEVS
jgi:hypothetical protein